MRYQNIREKRKREDRILILSGIVFLIIFCIGGFLLLDYYLETRKQEKMNAQLAELKHGYQSDSFIYVEALPLDMEDATTGVQTGISQSGNETQPGESNQQDANGQGAAGQAINAGEQEQTSLKDINPDYVFWLQIPDTEIDYPVVQKDNEYYLKRDFFGEKNKHGTIFLDVNCEVEGEFLLLHGHNMKDGTMFGSLRNYKKKDYASEHGELIISRDKRDDSFEIVAAALVDLYDANRLVYEKLPTTEEEAYTYFEELRKHALWCSDISWEPGQKVVLLSTCDYGTEEQRFVVFAIEKK